MARTYNKTSVDSKRLYLERFRTSGKSARQYCSEQGLNYWTFRSWVEKSGTMGGDQGPHRGAGIKRSSVALAPVSSPLKSAFIRIGELSGGVPPTFTIRFVDGTQLEAPGTLGAGILELCRSLQREARESC
jgi:hypothetical protein